MKLDASSEDLNRTEVLAERADAYRAALALLRQFEWASGAEPDDALRLAVYLMQGPEAFGE